MGSSCGLGQRQFRHPQEMSNPPRGRSHADSQCWFLFAAISRSSLRTPRPLGQIWKEWSFEGGSLLGHGVTMMGPGAGPPAVRPFMTCVGILGLEVTRVRASLVISQIDIGK